MRVNVCVVGTKGTGFTYIAHDLCLILSSMGYKVVGRLQPQADGSVGRKWIPPPYLGRGDEDYSIATTERTEVADLVIVLSSMGNPAGLVRDARRGGVIVADTSHPNVRYWLEEMMAEAWKRGVRLVDVDSVKLLRDAGLPATMRNMFILGVALPILNPLISEHTVRGALRRAYAEEVENILPVIEAGMRYGRRLKVTL
ncbi:MAG: hypothetical protein DRJ97_08495 [Thermoprotei archaeon]|nr:MAG: hypothetical protein DRJ97_08495 [Thermoprotei archaeon]